MSLRHFTLLDEVTTVGAGSAVDHYSPKRSFQLVGSTTTGAGAVTVDVEASNDGGTNWLVLGTINLTLGTAETSDGFAIDAAWDKVRGNVKSISGTGAKCSLHMGA